MPVFEQNRGVRMKSNKRMVMIIAVLLAAAMSLTALPQLASPALGATSSEDLKEQLEALQQQKAENDAKLTELEAQIGSNRDDVSGILKEKSAVEQQMQLLYEQTVLVNTQITTYNQLIAQKQVEMDEAIAQYDKLNEAYKDRIRTMEEAGELSYWSVLFKASSFSDFLDRLNMIGEIANADSRRLQELKAAADAVEQARQSLETARSELEASRVDMEQTQAALEEKSKQSDVLLQQLLDKAEDLDSLLEQFEKNEQEFLDQIADKKEEYDTQVKIEESIKASKQASQQASKDASKKASQQASKEASKNHSATAPTDGGGNSNVGANNPSGVVWLVPCTYTRVTSPFGYRWHPKTGEWSMHKGVDLGARKGTPIYASRSGKVTVATHHQTAGNYVTINHQDGYRSTYMHMTYYVVKVNQYVQAGELIGYVGDSGRTTGPHLHFGILYGDGYVDPMKYIG